MTGATAFKATAAFCKSDQGRPNGFFYTSLSDIHYFARKISRGPLGAAALVEVLG